MAFIRSISGLRATLGDGLLPSKVAEYAAAFAAYLPKGAIVIGRDGRPSGQWIENIICGTLIACGREVRLIGVTPTPTVQLMVEHSDAAGGIAITASHNPSNWNGLKFLNSSGVFLDRQENEAFWEFVDDRRYDFIKSNFPNMIKDHEAIDLHIKSILKNPIISDTNVLNIVRDGRIIAAVDAVNSSGSVAVPSLLAQFGIQTNKLFCNGTGIFPHTPEPIPDNLTELAEYVRKSDSTIGIAVDPDADRLVLIDETGKPIGEELTIALAVKQVLSHKELFKGKYNPSVVVNHSTTRAVEDIAEEHGAIVYRCPVGEINVVNKMKETRAMIGGEGSGGVILPSCHYGRDSLVGISLVISLLVEKKMTLSELVRTLPHYEMIKTKVLFTGDIAPILEKVKQGFKDFDILEEDGVKFTSGKKWVQIRASNTEPIFRIIAEAESRDQAIELVEKVKELTKR
jgi:phosphomannomutase